MRRLLGVRLVFSCVKDATTEEYLGAQGCLASQGQLMEH